MNRFYIDDNYICTNVCYWDDSIELRRWHDQYFANASDEGISIHLLRRGD